MLVGNAEGRIPFSGGEAMSTNQRVERDEWKMAVENASYTWGLIFVTYALLIDVVYRSAVRNEAAWDLLALAMMPGIICTVYQARHKTVGWSSAVLMLVVAVIVTAFILTMYVTGRLK
jgi:hypothetical protein